jgi:hypothetical protein
MFTELSQFLLFTRKAFSRPATYHWFVVVFIGFIVRTDTLGVTSIIRSLALMPSAYELMLNFFHSGAWTVTSLTATWWQWLMTQQLPYKINDRLVLLADHTKTPEDGRKIPAVSTLHQDSETASKPSFFRGHHWGCIAMLMKGYNKFFATGLYAQIHEGLSLFETSDKSVPKTVKIVQMANAVTIGMGIPCYLVLDAYFAVGTVFLAASALPLIDMTNSIYIITRAKKNVTAYKQAKKIKGKRPPGKPKFYGEKLKLMTLFDSNTYTFKTAKAPVYDKVETVRYLSLDLLWKPVKGLLRFILIENSRGRIILITSDLHLDPMIAMQLYCHRTKIETLFDTLKNTFGAMSYHFWSQCLSPASRKHRKNKAQVQVTYNIEQTRKTLNAIEKFVNIHLLVSGFLQYLAVILPEEVKQKSLCWLRTESSKTPSEFVAKLAVTNLIKDNLRGLPKNWIIALILRRQNSIIRQQRQKMTG